jgi:hypothetical protein
MNTPTLRVCADCRVAKPEAEYYRNSTSRDRVDKKCKECKKAATRKWKVENRERARETDRRWREQNRERANAHYRKWRHNNRERHRELCRRWNADNRDRCKENLDRWRQSHREQLAEWRRQRRTKLLAGPRYSEVEWHALLAAFGYRCAACGLEARDTPQGFLTPDHVIPVCMSGPNTIDNIQPLCLDCNRRKNGRVIDYRPNWPR